MLECVDNKILVSDMIEDINLKAYINNVYLKTEFVNYSLGVTDAGKPITLNGVGKLDPSLLTYNVLTFRGGYTPVSGAEYPDSTGAINGNYWTTDVDYTFTGGDLSGTATTAGDAIVWSGTSWSYMKVSLDPTDYFKLDGTTTMAANAPMGGFKVTGLGAGTTGTDGVNKAQLDLKADITYVNSETDAIDTAIALKADQTDVDLKASIAYVDASDDIQVSSETSGNETRIAAMVEMTQSNYDALAVGEGGPGYEADKLYIIVG